MPYKDAEKRREWLRRKYIKDKINCKCVCCGVSLEDDEGALCVNCRFVRDYGSVKGVLHEVNYQAITK